MKVTVFTESNEMETIFFLLLISTMWNLVLSNTKCHCNKSTCVIPVNCTHGLVWDHCYCCRTCAKSEGEVCGGKNYEYGECGKWQECVVRRRRNFLNRFKKHNEMIGRCEPYSCAYERCQFGQRCSIKEGYTHCGCDINCSGMLKGPVCGETNMKYYKNECELRKEECRIGKRIGISISPCPGSSLALVSCTASKMELKLSRKIFGRSYPRRLALNDPSCRAFVNRTHVIASTILIGCGTKTRYTTTSVIYSNKLRTLPPRRNALISRGKKVDIPFSCEYVLRGRTKDRVRFTQIRPSIEKSIQPGKYTRNIGNGIYVEVDTLRNYTVALGTSRYKGLNVKLLPVHCYATPLQRGYQNTKFTIINKGCPTETNVKVKSFTDTRIVIQIPGIRFKKLRKSGSNIKCQVRLCFPATTIKAASCDINCISKSRTRRSLFISSEEQLKSNSFRSIVRTISRHKKPLFVHRVE